ncbi:uncharacterized protein LOC123258432 [Cotesia glomerata]|uniref:uncharacterized protein LOC123258432 n=1 Tax=Cotesia glomerata TaxID=32391 RepID=UPI001D02D16B|nr:uncharacterized protein LOC123258432 [Cotesia glomerata]
MAKETDLGDRGLPPEVEMILNLEPKFDIEIKEKWNVIPTVIKDLEFGIGAVKLDNCNIAEKEIVKNNWRSKAINTYKLLSKDPTNKWQKVANDLVKGKHLKANYTVAPRIYGLRKTHKQTCSLRPVVSCVNSPSYNLVRFLHEILSPVIETFQYNVKNSFDFVAFSKTVSLPEGYVLISLDVVSLFTNVRRDLILKVIEETWDNIKHLVRVPRKVLEDLIIFCYDSSYFVYQGEFYSQMEGSSMGNPTSPVIANIVMNYVIGQILMLLPFDVHFLRLYVDDTIVAIPEGEVNNILELFNSFDSNIQFTLEVEKDNSLSFLDVLVKRPDGKLLTDWFIKPISSGRLLNWNSNHPRSQKIGMIKGLLDRMSRLSSSDFNEVNFKKIRNMLLKNNYDLSLVDSVINRFKENMKNKTSSLGNINNSIKYCQFPYVAELSQRIPSEHNYVKLTSE